MKVLLVVPHIGEESSGPSYSVPGLCCGLAENGVETRLSFLGKMPERLKGEKYKAISYPQHGKFHLGWSPEMLKGLREACKTADIIHDNSLWMMPNVYPAWAVKGTKCKLVVAPRGTLAAWSLKKGWLKKKIFGWLLQNQVLRRADMFHATSEKEYEEIRAAGYKQPVAIVPIGMDIPCGNEVKVRGEGEQRSDLHQVVFFGRLHKVKAVDRLVQAWELLMKEEESHHCRPRPRTSTFSSWELVIAGPDNGIRGELEKYIADHKVPRVRFVGELNGPAKYDFLSAADLYVLPSHTENFGVTVAEALACGTPVIVSKGTPWSGVENVAAKNSDGLQKRSANATRTPCDSRLVPCSVRGDVSNWGVAPDPNSEAARFKTLAEKKPEELTSEEKREIVRAIEATEVICLGLPKDEKITRFLKGYWDGDAKVTRDIVEWGSRIVPVSVINRYIGEIRTHKNSIRSILFHTRFRGPLKVLVLERLADVLKYAVLYNKGRDGDETFYNLAHRLQFDPGDGKPVKEFIVRLIVKETAEGNRTWTVEFSNKKELTGMPTTGEAATVEVTHLKSPSTHTILKLLYAVNGAGEEDRGRGNRSTADGGDLDPEALASNENTESHHCRPRISTSTSSRCGWWVDNDPETLAKTLRKAMALSDDVRRRMGEAGRGWIRRDFSWEGVGAKMKSAYEWLLGQGSKPEWVKER